VDGIYPPNWRPYHADAPDTWPVASAIQLWAELGNMGFERDDYLFMDLCRRINFELKACSLKLADLSSAYHAELLSLCRRREFSEGKRFSTGNSMFVFIRTHAFLSEMGTLRDYLAEFISQFALLGSTIGSVRSMSNLRKKAPDVLRPEPPSRTRGTGDYQRERHDWLDGTSLRISRSDCAPYSDGFRWSQGLHPRILSR